MAGYIGWLEEFGRDDTDKVGGKNSSLGEMIRGLKDQGVRVPEGFAITVDGYRAFLEHNDLTEKIKDKVSEYEAGGDLGRAGRALRRMITHGDFPDDLAEGIRQAYRELSEHYGETDVDVAVRSSATAEDLPEASFAGQQETVLNVLGEEEILDAVRYCYSSLFTDRAISYRQKHDFEQTAVGLSVGVQKMVRAGRACSGVLFTVDTESGFPDVVVVTGAYGLGEHIVQGGVNPDEWTVFKPLLHDDDLVPIIDKRRGSKASKMVYSRGEASPTKVVDTRRREQEMYVLSDAEVLQLARWGVAIEDHYGHAVDVEWAKDGESQELFVVQARPETVQSRRGAGVMKTYRIDEPTTPLVTGVSVGDTVAAGVARVLTSLDQADLLGDGEILVTELTDPDWVPLMQRAAAVVTDRGGRTAHAAIVSRELGIPAVVGAGDATQKLPDGEEVTVSCAEGELGKVYGGVVDWDEFDVDLEDVPDPETDIMMNIASPAGAFRWWRLPSDGVGLARMEFIINEHIQIHPMALVRFDDVTDDNARRRIEELTTGFDDLEEYFVERLARGVGKIAAAHHPRPVIVRMSDFKTNEYADLVGGAQFEPHEANPMLGFRGASRYYSEQYREGFELECRAIRRVRDVLGLRNVKVMLPFVRTVGEADRVIEVLAEEGLRRGEDDLELYVMCELPSNVLLAGQFAERFDGFSIGSNDLTQLILGVDRDTTQLSELFDERDEAVTVAIRQVIESAHEAGIKVGICGQGPSDHPDLAEFLVEAGIDSMSLNPDAIIETRRRIAELEKRLG
ncbi:MAG: phosphoenolpyruvate synthase [Actinomycetota bacterium]|nr:phosphoenolpyruvate synthase [Actinomycetota bacterium]MDQ3640413.1 phosphoenolpyruvate synthase [Actinomycetota bacterium]